MMKKAYSDLMTEREREIEAREKNIQKWLADEKYYSHERGLAIAVLDLNFLLAQLRKAQGKLKVLDAWREANHICPVDYCCWSAALDRLDQEAPCEKCRGTGARHVAGEPTQEPCGECSGEGVISVSQKRVE